MKMLTSWKLMVDWLFHEDIPNVSTIEHVEVEFSNGFYVIDTFREKSHFVLEATCRIEDFLWREKFTVNDYFQGLREGDECKLIKVMDYHGKQLVRVKKGGQLYDVEPHLLKVIKY